MRHLLSLLLLLLTSMCDAQNWALLNPAYRYNYSDDGTDTISNQIRVVNVDTLGTDSFRYVFNNVGVICQTCPISLGGLCSGCFIKVDQSQFLGAYCIRSGRVWSFPQNGHLLNHAPIDSAWIYGVYPPTTARIDSIWQGDVLGLQDSLLRIIIDNSDWVLLSKSFGIVKYFINGTSYDLVGIEGLNIGTIYPDPLTFFNYQPGDQLTYRVQYMTTVSYPGGPMVPMTRSKYYQINIIDRENILDGITYSISTNFSGTSGANLGWESALPTSTWTITRTSIANDHAVLISYPGEVINTFGGWLPGSGTIPKFIADYQLDDAGMIVISSRNLVQGLNGEWDTLGGFNFVDEVAPMTYPFMSELVVASYHERLGLVHIAVDLHTNFGRGRKLVGAILDGDTIIPPPVIDWATGVEEERATSVSLFPNPSSDSFMLKGGVGGKAITIHDMEGRSVLSMRLKEANEAIDVRDLKAGVYILRVNGLRPQQLVIAR